VSLATLVRVRQKGIRTCGKYPGDKLVTTAKKKSLSELLGRTDVIALNRKGWGIGAVVLFESGPTPHKDRGH